MPALTDIASETSRPAGTVRAEPTLPAILDGTPAFADPVPLNRPSLPIDDQLVGVFREVLDSGIVTKGSHLAAFERELAAYLDVQHAVVVSSCTSGLVLTLRCLGLSGEVVMPSFTFMASGHAALWNGLVPSFADIDEETFNLTAEHAQAMLGSRTSAILAVHTFGAPCDADGLADLASRQGIPLVIDAAPAFGARYRDGSAVGTKGLAEVFSLSPTKTFTTGEGGIVATADESLARELRIAREYGNPGNYDSLLAGLNGRMPELSAALGRHGLPLVSQWLEQRRSLADRYRANLADLPGVTFQRIPPGESSTAKDVCIRVDPAAFGIDRDMLTAALDAEGIATRRYFDPPLHEQSAYRHLSVPPLPVTTSLAKSVIALPIYSHLPPSTVDRICEAVRRIQAHAEQITAAAASRE
jgi:dTDP-4-amino-4,6-dideoxygalactose transaminase